MAKAELAMLIGAPAHVVWAAFAGPQMVPLMLETYAQAVDMSTSGSAAGTVIVTTLKAGGIVRERVEFLDDREYCMRYRVLDAGPLPYANYQGEGRVQPSGPDACVVSLECSFVPVGITAAEAVQSWQEHNWQGLNALKRFVEREQDEKASRTCPLE